jgi:hypothetical protein
MEIKLCHSKHFFALSIGGWKKSATMDIYLQHAGVDTKSATDCFHFVPEDIYFGDTAVSIFDKGKSI